jgi:hypothetical protein
MTRKRIEQNYTATLAKLRFFFVAWEANPSQSHHWPVQLAAFVSCI